MRYGYRAAMAQTNIGISTIAREALQVVRLELTQKYVGGSYSVSIEALVEHWCDTPPDPDWLRRFRPRTRAGRPDENIPEAGGALQSRLERHRLGDAPRAPESP